MCANARTSHRCPTGTQGPCGTAPTHVTLLDGVQGIAWQQAADDSGQEAGPQCVPWIFGRFCALLQRSRGEKVAAAGSRHKRDALDQAPDGGIDPRLARWTGNARGIEPAGLSSIRPPRLAVCTGFRRSVVVGLNTARRSPSEGITRNWAEEAEEAEEVAVA